MAKRTPFSNEEDQFIVKNLNLMSKKNMGEALKRNPDAIYQRIKRLKRDGKIGNTTQSSGFEQLFSMVGRYLDRLINEKS